jgi:hypothetical protein
MIGSSDERACDVSEDRPDLGEMKTAKCPCPVTRQDLEESWRLRLEETQDHYSEARERYRELLHERPGGLAPSPDRALTLARQAELQARTEYTRVLRIFTDLTVYGKMPAERLAASVGGE